MKKNPSVTPRSGATAPLAGEPGRRRVRTGIALWRAEGVAPYGMTDGGSPSAGEAPSPGAGGKRRTEGVTSSEKRILSILLTALLALALPITALAENPETTEADDGWGLYDVEEGSENVEEETPVPTDPDPKETPDRAAAPVETPVAETPTPPTATPETEAQLEATRIGPVLWIVLGVAAALALSAPAVLVSRKKKR